ncbi:MAG TPA: cobyrinate a,c-diamide synthase [Roseiarcus sp.]|nr:cobyrinate a,c-diamide synthase [Roseiarcus sp.]
MIPPGLVIAAPRSGSGKTTLALGLMRAFRRRGLKVVGLKCGPDYIDPGFHQAATGRPGANLDSWAMSPALLRAIGEEAARDADLVLCEGLMGLFDGVPAPEGRSGSSADIAAAFGWPVLLVLDVSGQSQSAGAAALGCKLYDSRIEIRGVILNRVGSDRHRRLATQAIEQASLPTLGALPRSTEIALPERHLGLVQAGETSELEARLDRLADFVEAHVDVDRIFALAASSPSSASAEAAPPLPPAQRIAVARDEAFSFLYPHLEQSWRRAGAELRFFSPLADEAPPADCDFCWLPGGYPELHAGRLAAARNFLSGVRRFAATRPVHGECGGYMVLGRSLIDSSSAAHDMIGLLGLVSSFATRRMTLGYRQATLLRDGPLGRKDTRYRGHEFHYATIVEPGGDEPFAEVKDAHGSTPVLAGGRRGDVTGSFFHLIAPVEQGRTG